MPKRKILNRGIARTARRQLARAPRGGLGSVGMYMEHWNWHHHQDHEKEYKAGAVRTPQVARPAQRLARPRMFRAGKIRGR
jgi:hypothetical protein